MVSTGFESGKYICRLVRMSTQDYFNPCFCLYFFDNCLFIRAVIRNARCNMNFCNVFINRLVPEVDLRKPSNNGGTRTIAAVNKAYQLGIIAVIPAKIAGPSVKAHHAPGTADTYIVHGSFAPDNQYFFHAFNAPVVFLPCPRSGFSPSHLGTALRAFLFKTWFAPLMRHLLAALRADAKPACIHSPAASPAGTGSFFSAARFNLVQDSPLLIVVFYKTYIMSINSKILQGKKKL